MTKLYLDDVRNPPAAYEFVIVRNYEEFVEWIKKNGVPDVVSFDYDLADIHYDTITWKESFEYREKTGHHAAKWLIEHCNENQIPFPKSYCHSQNPVGSENIMKSINSYLERTGQPGRCERRYW